MRIFFIGAFLVIQVQLLAQQSAYEECFNEIELRESILKGVMNSKAFKKVIHNAKVNEQNVFIYDYQSAIFGAERGFEFDDVHFEIHFWKPNDSTLLDTNILFEIVDVIWLSEHILLKAEFLNHEFQFLFKIKKCKPSLIDESWSIY